MGCPECGRDKPILAKNLCAACYMRRRRREKAGPAFVARAPTGAREGIAMAYRHDWVGRFHEKIDTSGDCHEWSGGSTAGGYGVFHTCGYTYLAHRLAFLLAGGEMDYSVVMHSCDNPKCVNPAHLSGGDHKANMDDMVAKGRRNVTGRCGKHLRDRATHPRAKAVRTPEGEFPSASLAADALGLHAKTIARRATDEVKGFSWA